MDERRISNLDDDLHDIAGIPIDHFWRKVVENLPTDWAFRVTAMQHDGEMRYRARAALVEYDGDGTSHEVGPHIQTDAYQRVERCLEALFYQLRDIL